LRLDKAVLLKRLFSIIERNLLIKKFIKEIIYSKENIKITFFYSENFKNFSLENSPARRQAGRASVSFESQESLNPINKEEFVFQSTAPDRKSLQTFNIILPNLIHKLKKRNLKI